MLSGMWSMNIVNTAKPRQKSMRSMRFAGAAMFPRPDFIDRPRLTVIHFDRWLKCDDPRAVAWRCGEGPMACCHRGGRRHAQAAAQSTELADQNDGAPPVKRTRRV